MAPVNAVLNEAPRPDIYILEYYHNETRAKLPHLFSTKFKNTVPSKVLLTDPVGNPFTVSISTDQDHPYFSDGWNYLGAFYGLQEGGWITMRYPSVGVFNIQVSNVSGDQVTYPPMPEPIETNHHHNPIVLDDDDVDMEDADPLPFMVDRSKLVTIVNKWLSFDEITGVTLRFSKDWSQYALPKTDGHLSLVDEYGKVWPCYYKAKLGNGDVGGIYRGWKSFYREKKLYQGQGVKFGVMVPNSNVLYFTPSS